jgi:hypothetical protein
VRSHAEHGERFLQPQNTMEPKNTFIFRQSELPPLSDELKAEIAEIDFNVVNLIRKIQGHYYALSELTEVQ